MSDETGTRPPDGGEPAPVIPDGGLSDAMPDWLRRPPAWRGMPVPEPSPPPESAEATGPVAGDAPDERQGAETEHATRIPKDLPPSDTSPIDPSTLIDLSDLPEWLVGLGKRDLPERPEPGVTSAAVVETAPAGTAPLPLPPFLREGAPVDGEPSATVETPEMPAFAGMSRRFLVLAGVLAVVILVAILLAYLG